MFTPWKRNILFLIVALFYNFYTCSGQSSTCLTANNKSGICIEIRRCQQLYDLLLTSSQSQKSVDLLRASQCGYEGRYPKVCCGLDSDISTTTSTSTTTARTTAPIIRTISDMQCGHSNSTKTRIVGGQPSDLGAWPWMAALGYRTPSKPGPDFRCGGTLITSRHVVTAAHCVLNIGSYTLTVVRLGELDLNDAVQDGASPIDIQVSKITPHSNYLPKPVENDIAIITLQNPVQFTKHIQPICLPKQPQLRSESFNKRLPYIIGWGATAWRAISSTHLQEAQVPTVDLETCKQRYAEKKEAVIDNRVICAGDGTKDSCQGDSGGPLILPNGTTYYLIGIVSFGIRCAEPNFPGVYTRVTQFLDWIDINTA